ncbi:MAG: hypothetical protein PVSMB6_17610 [Steroidobacteraceae bacterium]
MRAVILTLLVTAFAVWFLVQRGRVVRAREYSNARWGDEGGSSQPARVLRGNQAMMS